MLSLLCSEYEPKSVFHVFVMTSASFVGMTLYALTTKHDISVYWSLASGASVCMLTFTILLFFINNKAVYLIYSMFGVILGLLFVAIDTRMIIKDRKYGIGLDDYVVGALLLYLDILQIFIHLLRLFGSRK